MIAGTFPSIKVLICRFDSHCSEKPATIQKWSKYERKQKELSGKLTKKLKLIWRKKSRKLTYLKTQAGKSS
jgi:hypothetical protein